MILFDVDGTLISVKKGGSGSYNLAIKNLHGLTVNHLLHPVNGLTDTLVLAYLLKNEGWNDEKINKHLPELVVEFERVYLENVEAGSYRLLPGVKQLLDALDQPDITLGLITGNLEVRARTKLQDVGIWDVFSVGAFGSDPHNTRGDLVKLAVNRAGFSENLSNVYVIGDTPRDIHAAKEAKVKHKVAVASEDHSEEELKKAGADIILPDLKNTEAILKKLGVRLR